MKDLFQVRPPLALSASRDGLLAGLAEAPPRLGRRVRRHAGHVGVEVVARVFEVAEEEVLFRPGPMKIDGVVLDSGIPGSSSGRRARPRRGAACTRQRAQASARRSCHSVSRAETPCWVKPIPAVARLVRQLAAPTTWAATGVALLRNSRRCSGSFGSPIAVLLKAPGLHLVRQNGIVPSGHTARDNQAAIDAGPIGWIGNPPSRPHWPVPGSTGTAFSTRFTVRRPILQICPPYNFRAGAISLDRLLPLARLASANPKRLPAPGADRPRRLPVPLRPHRADSRPVTLR